MKATLAAMTVVLALPAAANNLPKAYEPAAMDLTESWDFTPQLSVGLGYDDNTAYSSANEIDSWFVRTAPELLVHAGNDRTRYEVGYRLVDGRYFDSSEDNYTDHSLHLGLKHHFTRRHRIDLFYNYRRQHEARGTGIAEGRGQLLDGVVEMNVHDAKFVYGFGARSARFNADLELGYYDKEHTNFREFSRFRDYDTQRAIVTLYTRVGSRTQVFGEWRGYDNNYKHTEPGVSSRDSVNQQLFAGLRWDATSKTSGSIRLGIEDRNFDAADREDFDGATWQVSVDWKPRSYSVFTFESGSRSKDPDTLGDFVEEDSYRLGWQHDWRERISTNADIEYIENSFTGFDRQDQLLQLRLGVAMAWKRWLVTELSYQLADQDSNIGAVTYDKNLFMATARISL
ncbi:outer membrane beta-barrel protein [Ferrimonas senticii]|uniref:outer membrane beta-barrel protein n=1 Tax=Ferrimonas senticii TaxID=394566 RepID=UPI0004270137|nr:outer membrane beta-barrel protein [Ferrimonas senticii]